MRIALLLCCVAAAVPCLDAFVWQTGERTEFRVELPADLRRLAGGGRVSPIREAHVAVSLPTDFDPAREWPIFIVSATSDPGYRSCRKLMEHYLEPARAAGWILLAADPVTETAEVAQEEDTTELRAVMIFAALNGLAHEWPAARRWPIAFGGFSGGAKRSGWMAAFFTRQGRRPIGVFQTGINHETVAQAGRDYRVRDPEYTSIPVFLLSGDKDVISTPKEHRQVLADLGRGGFKHTRLETFPGPHAIAPAPLRTALDWFREIAAASGQN